MKLSLLLTATFTTLTLSFPLTPQNTLNSRASDLQDAIEKLVQDSIAISKGGSIQDVVDDALAIAPAVAADKSSKRDLADSIETLVGDSIGIAKGGSIGDVIGDALDVGKEGAELGKEKGDKR